MAIAGAPAPVASVISCRTGGLVAPGLALGRLPVHGVPARRVSRGGAAGREPAGEAPAHGEEAEACQHRGAADAEQQAVLQARRAAAARLWRGLGDVRRHVMVR
jgi:hypothetical protein